jgi:hypothetical protein
VAQPGFKLGHEVFKGLIARFWHAAGTGSDDMPECLWLNAAWPGPSGWSLHGRQVDLKPAMNSSSPSFLPSFQIS